MTKIARVSFTSTDRVRAARVEHLYAIADGEVTPEEGKPDAVLWRDGFGPLSLMPHPGRQWADRSGRRKNPDREPSGPRDPTGHQAQDHPTPSELCRPPAQPPGP